MTSLRPWLVAALVFFCAGPLFAQGAAKSADAEKIPDPVDVTLDSNGVLLRGTYYKSLLGRESVPVILLPDYQNADKSMGSRSDYRDLCLQLQAAGHACLALDWRGIGDSTKTKAGVDFAPKKLRSETLAMVFKFDMEAAKNWLMARNNDQELNINRLTIVAAGASTPVAINWAVQDWSWPILPGRGKQGQDVKALVLLSPTWNAAGYGIDEGINFLAKTPGISVQIGVGARSGGATLKDANKVDDRIKAARPEDKKLTPEEAAKVRTLFYVEYETQFQGTKLLGQANKLLEEHIKKFIQLRAVDQPYDWDARQ